MARRGLRSGIELTHGNGLAVQELGPIRAARTVRRSVESAVPAPTGSLEEALEGAFTELGLSILDVVELEPSVAEVRRGGTAATDDANFSVPMESEESALVLVIQDGVLRWVFPKYTPIEPMPADSGITIDLSPAPDPVAPVAMSIPETSAIRRKAVFQLQGGDEPRRTTHKNQLRRSISQVQEARRGGADAAARQGLFDDVTSLIHTSGVIDWALGKVRAYVLKFAGRVAIEAVVHHLESRLFTGLVALPGHSEIPAWKQAEQLSDLVILPSDRPARILLFCHGTFSSTFGSFVGLENTDFLTDAWKQYDAVVGYDHKSLSIDPKVNATDLHTRLSTAFAGLMHPPQIDAISYSRGGLVYRSLSETLAPNWRWGRSVFVAAPNGGTHLADPANWKRLVDLYTNLALATGKALSLATPYALPVAELIGGLGAFVKYLASEVVDENAVPGLAAMNPEGAFVAALNQVQVAGVVAQQTIYTIASNFEATNNPDPFLKKIGVVLLDEGLLDPLFQGENDLVVDTNSSGILAPGFAVAGSKLYAPGESVYHLNYFVQAETQSHLATWLL